MIAKFVADLPRFSEDKGLSPLIVFDDEADEPEAVEPVDDIQPIEEIVAEVPQDVLLREAEARFQQEAQQTLESLSCAIEEIKRSSSLQISSAISEIASELFPHLSSEFLAEEFALHVPSLVQLAPPSVNVQASPRIAEHLNFVSRKMEAWPVGWAIETIDDLEETRVQMVWDKGGLTYDLERILEVCLNRLSDHINHTEKD